VSRPLIFALGALLLLAGCGEQQPPPTVAIDRAALAEQEYLLSVSHGRFDLDPGSLPASTSYSLVHTADGATKASRTRDFASEPLALDAQTFEQLVVVMLGELNRIDLAASGSLRDQRAYSADITLTTGTASISRSYRGESFADLPAAVREVIETLEAAGE